MNHHQLWLEGSNESKHSDLYLLKCLKNLFQKCICIFVYVFLCLCICVFVYLCICVFVYMCVCVFTATWKSITGRLTQSFPQTFVFCTMYIGCQGKHLFNAFKSLVYLTQVARAKNYPELAKLLHVLGQLLVGQLLRAARVCALVLHVLDHHHSQQALVVAHRLPTDRAVLLPLSCHLHPAGAADKVTSWAGKHLAPSGHREAHRALHLRLQLLH